MSWEILFQERTDWTSLPNKYETKKASESGGRRPMLFQKPQLKTNYAKLAKKCQWAAFTFQITKNTSVLRPTFTQHISWFGATFSAQAKHGCTSWSLLWTKSGKTTWGWVNMASKATLWSMDSYSHFIQRGKHSQCSPGALEKTESHQCEIHRQLSLLSISENDEDTDPVPVWNIHRKLPCVGKGSPWWYIHTDSSGWHPQKAP